MPAPARAWLRECWLIQGRRVVPVTLVFAEVRYRVQLEMLHAPRGKKRRIDGGPAK
jgi:hypothetical protein